VPSEALDARGVRRGGREAVERAGGTLLRERPPSAAVRALSARQALSDIVLGVRENAVRAGQAVLRGDLHRPAATMCGCRSHEGEIAARAPVPPAVHSIKHVVHPGRHCAGEVVEVDSPSPTRSSLRACQRRGSGRGVQVTQGEDRSKSARQSAVEQVVLQPPAHSSGLPTICCRMPCSHGPRIVRTTSTALHCTTASRLRTTTHETKSAIAATAPSSGNRGAWSRGIGGRTGQSAWSAMTSVMGCCPSGCCSSRCCRPARAIAGCPEASEH
jgi:hypothetical protein